MQHLIVLIINFNFKNLLFDFTLFAHIMVCVGNDRCVNQIVLADTDMLSGTVLNNWTEHSVILALIILSMRRCHWAKAIFLLKLSFLNINWHDLDIGPLIDLLRYIYFSLGIIFGPNLVIPWSCWQINNLLFIILCSIIILGMNLQVVWIHLFLGIVSLLNWFFALVVYFSMSTSRSFQNRLVRIGRVKSNWNSIPLVGTISTRYSKFLVLYLIVIPLEWWKSWWKLHVTINAIWLSKIRHLLSHLIGLKYIWGPLLLCCVQSISFVPIAVLAVVNMLLVLFILTTLSNNWLFLICNFSNGLCNRGLASLTKFWIGSFVKNVFLVIKRFVSYGYIIVLTEHLDIFFVIRQVILT